MTPLFFAALLDTLPELMLGVSASAALYSLWIAFIALRAKGRIHQVLLDKAADDPAMRDIIIRASTGQMSEREIENAREQIYALTHELPDPNDRKYVELGLRQASASGASRYVREILREVVQLGVLNSEAAKDQQHRQASPTL